MKIYNDNILNTIKKSIGNSFYKLISIEKFDDINHEVLYVKLDFYNNVPIFGYDRAYFDFKLELRDSIIDLIMSQKEDSKSDFFDVEDVIYSEEQKEILNKLRNTNKLSNKLTRLSSEVLEAKVEYSKTFKIGDKVYYNGYHGFITFQHQNSKTRYGMWSVKVGDTEHRYINGVSLRKRVVNDLSNTPIDKELDKMSTEKLLKMYKRSRVRGIGSTKIKRILNMREHIQKGENKIINHVH